jgi:hypothetical protein
MRRIALLIAFVLVFMAASLLHTPEQHTQAGGGFPAYVMVLKDDVGSAVVVAAPSAGAEVILEMTSSDRVLRTSGAIVIQDDGVYIPVYTARGEAGWLLNGEEITAEISPVYTTSSTFETGSEVEVKAGGRGSACHLSPSLGSETIQELNEGDRLTISDGPYQAELGVWWPVTLSAGEECWIYDTPGYFDAVSP